MVAAAIIFLLTATRDEQLFRALEEAAHSVVEKKGTAWHGTHGKKMKKLMPKEFD